MHEMLDALKDDLLEARKNLEKSLIQTFVASQSHATSENRKQMLKMMKQEKIDGIKSNCTSYVDGLSTTAKGKWVTQAKQTFKQTTSKFDNC
ncbi:MULTISPECIES: hypothetical protein [unclassified Enterococcus]|uniref:LXG domain-containing protein n=1 Tax=Candidatus Enterococcus dunnyi TaxID=1834192 RepID=A0A200J1B1_9ENTE|nr:MULTISPECIES: hypothetical protein [unclassified Enterococcus]OUZ30621.1 hypothetical protein A5889_002909 [Enterococcus sp. 9D6_DIV0238]